MAVVVRRFARGDRDQVADLVNAHASAVIPGGSVSVSSLMSQLEREPSEFIVDPWVAERATLVAVQRQRVVAAAHLLRYADDVRVSETYRGAGEIRWLVCWPPAPFWPDSAQAGDDLATACLALLARWSVRRCYADGALPAPGVYGVPEQWPHIRDLYQRAGFRHDGDTQHVFLARVPDLARFGDSARQGLTTRRTLGINGTRISAVLDEEVIGYIEVAALEDASRTRRIHGWADIGNLHVLELRRRTGVGTWLLGQAADWLDLGGVTCLLAYGDANDAIEPPFLQARGFRLLTRTIRGLALPDRGLDPTR